MTNQLMQNFSEDSDIVTIMRTFLDILAIKCNRKKFCEEYGFHNKSFNQIVSNMSQIINSFNLEEEKETETWKNIDGFYNELSNNNELLKFIQRIIETIGSIKNEWISCRRAKYFTVNNILCKEVFVFTGDDSLIIGKEENSIIEMRNRRPGGVGFSVPGSCFIL
ncbi:hypothetical protein TRFO_05089 [Tritrichomonas foetus]|uniref:Uncharacterized protein n=1 Tax=Tritrichomonas foetus TaxID=1144522 RepID=A0A1J4K9P2_9EUKA|nr:hypothetical protein TRFO_05089 [Tritrichomonas foetus]|eukprot:OHT07955.1 hypothetical protein TRFO_05089 [Tritrichomonas foetus]